MPTSIDRHLAILALALGAAVVVAAEWARGGATNGASPSWLTLEVTVAGLALLVAWRRQEQLTLVPLLLVAVAYGLAIVLVHDAVGIPGDTDGAVYAAQGNQLLDGDYPRSEYPVGAVLLFGLDALLGGDSVLTTHGLLMIPFHVAAVAGIWMLGTRWSPWLAALVALWPANLLFVHLRFEPVVVALLVCGLVLARRERWVTAGAVLGVGAAVKWSPALACLVLVTWLLASRRPRDAVHHALGLVGAFLAVNLPFVVWQAGDVLAAYTTQSTRGIIAESLPYLPLRLFGLADVSRSGDIWDAARVPGWADGAAGAAQVLLLVGVLGVAVRVRGDLDAAVAVAALAPAVFLLTNRVFSPQFALVVLAVWAVAASLVVRTDREQLAVGVAAMLATWANAMVIPGFVDPFVPWSAFFFGLSLGLTAWLLAAAIRRPQPQMMIGTVPPSTDHAAPVT